MQIWNHLHEVGEAHKVAVGVDDEGGGEVASLDEQEGRVHPEDGRVGKLELIFFSILCHLS